MNIEQIFMISKIQFKFLVLGLLLVTALFESSLSYAQNQGRWYQVEVLVFKRETNITGGEFWQQNLSLSYPEDSQYINKYLPSSAHQLGGHNYTLRRDENYRVLFHQAWSQQMWGESESPSLIIRGGDRYGQHRELEGIIKIHIGRFLHVTTDLWLSDFIYQDDTSTNDSVELTKTKLPGLPFTTGSANPQAELTNALTTPDFVATFRERRRMRSEETHYIDHPLMGILIRMLPLKTPETTQLKPQ